MKHNVKTQICILGFLAATTTVDALAERSRNYEEIAACNVFRLKSPSKTIVPPSIDVPRILLQGITTILGHKQVLFKIQPAQPAEKEQSYILAEGGCQDDIEVLAIDEKAGSITFNNHGDIQILTMTRDSVGPPVVQTSGLKPIHPPTPNMSEIQKRTQSAMTSEEQVIMIEVERERVKEKVEAGELPPLPITELTPEGAK